MTGLVSADDIEPLDALERCDAAYGPHHIGRFDESRAELALIFDPRWISSESPLVEHQDPVWKALRSVDGHLHGWSFLGFLSPTRERDFRFLCNHLELSRSVDVDPQTYLIAAVVDLPPDAIVPLRQALDDHPSFVGYGNLSWPSDFRTIVYLALSYI